MKHWDYVHDEAVVESWPPRLGRGGDLCTAFTSPLWHPRLLLFFINFLNQHVLLYKSWMFHCDIFMCVLHLLLPLISLIFSNGLHLLSCVTGSFWKHPFFIHSFIILSVYIPNSISKEIWGHSVVPVISASALCGSGEFVYLLCLGRAHCEDRDLHRVAGGFACSWWDGVFSADLGVRWRHTQPHNPLTCVWILSWCIVEWKEVTQGLKDSVYCVIFSQKVHVFIYAYTYIYIYIHCVCFSNVFWNSRRDSLYLLDVGSCMYVCVFCF